MSSANDKIERDAKFESDHQYFRFHYDGIGNIDIGCGMCLSGHCGTLTNERLEMRQEQDESADRWWSHTYPHHKFEARTKEQLWEDIKEYISKDRPMFDAYLLCNGKTFVVKGVNNV